MTWLEYTIFFIILLLIWGLGTAIIGTIILFAIVKMLTPWWKKVMIKATFRKAIKISEEGERMRENKS